MTLLDRLSHGPKAWILLAVLTFAAAVPGVLAIPALDRDESRFAQASKQMLETGDFVQIRYQDEGRNKKPAGIHWLQAGAVALTSSAEAKQIWAYRLPSLLGAILATLGTFWAGLSFFERRVAFAGAALFGVGILLTSEAHIAKTDAALTASIVWAMGALARLYRGTERSIATALGLWGALGVSFMLKGPVGLMVAGLALGGLLLWDRRAAWAKPIADWRALALFALIVLPWFVWVQIATDGAFLEGAVGKDLGDKVGGASEGHGGPPGYHLLFLLTHFFPATLLLPAAFILTWRHLAGRGLEAVAGVDTNGLKFLIAWAIPTFLVFELLPTKLSHYVLPAYPALALLCGWALVQLMEGARGRVVSWVGAGLFALGAFVLLAVSSPIAAKLAIADALGDLATGDNDAIRTDWTRRSAFPVVVWGLAAALAGMATILSAQRRWVPGVLVAICASLALGWHIRAVFLPSQTWVHPTETALAALDELDLEEVGVVNIVGYSEPSAVFRLGTKTRIPPQTDVSLSSGDIWLINLAHPTGPGALDALLIAAEAEGKRVRQSNNHTALNYSNGDIVDFIALDFSKP